MTAREAMHLLDRMAAAEDAGRRTAMEASDAAWRAAADQPAAVARRAGDRAWRASIDALVVQLNRDFPYRVVSAACNVLRDCPYDQAHLLRHEVQS